VLKYEKMLVLFFEFHSPSSYIYVFQVFERISEMDLIKEAELGSLKQLQQDRDEDLLTILREYFLEDYGYSELAYAIIIEIVRL
jgi:hypothetical protein